MKGLWREAIEILLQGELENQAATIWW